MELRNLMFEVPTLGEVSFLLNIKDFNNDELIGIYKQLLTIRIFERSCAEGKKLGQIIGPVHLAIGQEAIPVGISRNLTSKDSVYSAHRSHAHLLALGADLRSVFAEILGKSTGVSGGFGGSMHLIDKSVGFQGSVPIVAGTVPLALGSAFAAKYKKSNEIAVAYFGDGAIEEGVVHECLNIAALMHLPILFICENNYMASHMHLSQRQSLGNLNRFASANGIESSRLDGNDPLLITNEISKKIEIIRKTQKPFFVELLTYRQLGHVDWREDIDVGVSRSTTEIDKWKEFDPIRRLEQTLIINEIISQEENIILINEISNYVKGSYEKAYKDPIPENSEILKNVYACDRQES